VTTLNTQVKRIAGLAGTTHVTEWEESFIESILEKTKQGDDTRSLTDRQITVIERLFKQHFAA
jgi:hypothetical protein